MKPGSASGATLTASDPGLPATGTVTGRRVIVSRSARVIVRRITVGGAGASAKARPSAHGTSATTAAIYAKALVDLGSALRRAGQPNNARERLAEGMSLAHACGATALVDRAHDELLIAGARPRRPALTGVDSLTPSERRIAEMAAREMTNKQIAQALFVTLRTVEMHLSNAYAKLEIRSRRQLPEALTSR